MADLLKINQDAMKVVQLSEMALGKASEWKLDTITYEIRDKDSKIVAEYEGRENQEAAQADADNRNFAEDIGRPFHVTQRSNLSVDQSGQLDFQVGSAIGIQFPFEAIDAAAEQLRNAIDCESIEEIIKDEIKRLKEVIQAKTTKIAELSPYASLLDLPSDPLDILSWAKKFVSLYLGPQVLAMIDLAMQIALTAQAISNIMIAVSAAQQNLMLCAVSVIDTVLEESIAAAGDIIDTAVPGLNDTLSNINDIQNKISDITGKPPVFDVANGVDGLLESATAENKAKFMSDVNEFATAAISPSDRSAAVSSIGGELSSDSTFAKGSLASAGAVTTQQQFTVGSQTFTFENGIMTAVS